MAKIHSIESCGTVDGPGIRFVVFTQGCPLRCQYCHNPDTWNINDGKERSVDELVKEALKYQSYMKFSGGGVTATGGEPLLQADFIKDFFSQLKKHHIHTALDTSGFIFSEKVKEVLALTDLVLLDIKNFNPHTYKTLTGGALQSTLDFLDYLGQISKPVWIRYVLVPGLTDNIKDIEALSKHLSHYTNIEKIELLPFHKMGEFKWKELGLDYKLSHVMEPTKDSMVEALTAFKMHNMNVVMN